jgi:hypothetical protein
MKSQSFNICWHVEYFDIERERSVEISTLDESSFIPSGRYQSIAAIKRNKSPLLKSKRYTRRGEPNKYWKSRCELVIMTAVTGQLTSRSRSNSAELTTMSACDGGELVTGWKEDHADRHAIPSLYPTDFCKSSSYFVLFCCFFPFGERPYHQSVSSTLIATARLFTRDRPTTGWISPFWLRLRACCQVTRRVYYRRVKLLGNITECKVMFDITHYRRTTSTGNNPMMCVYGEIRVPFGGRMIAVAQQSCE